MKNKAEFVRKLRKLYYPPVEVPEDDLGGFLVPEVITRNKKGWLAFICRRLGLLFRNLRLYRKGTVDIKIKDALIEAYLQEVLNGHS